MPDAPDGSEGPSAAAAAGDSAGGAYDAALADSRSLLLAWEPPGPDQSAIREEVVRYLDEHGPSALDRDNRAGHLTASTILLNAAGDHVLLTLHPFVKAWIQLGGHVERGEPGLRVAALREAHEESGMTGIALDPDPLGIDRHPAACRDSRGRRTPSVHLDVTFLATAPADAVPVRSDESLDLAWFPVRALPHPEPALQRLVAAAVARR